MGQKSKHGAHTHFALFATHCSDESFLGVLEQVM